MIIPIVKLPLIFGLYHPIRIVITILEYSHGKYRLAYWVLRQGPLG